MTLKLRRVQSDVTELNSIQMTYSLVFDELTNGLIHHIKATQILDPFAVASISQIRNYNRVQLSPLLGSGFPFTFWLKLKFPSRSNSSFYPSPWRAKFGKLGEVENKGRSFKSVN